MAANDDGVIPVAGGITDADEEFRLLNDVVRSLPPAPVHFLLSSRVCALCILRLFGKHGPIYCSSSRIFSLLTTVTGEPTPSEIPSEGSNDEGCVCKVCYGILEFVHYDEKHAFVKKDCAYDLAVSIFELAKREGYHVDGFSLEVSVPPFILENENSIRLLLKEKYSSEVWFSEMLELETMSIKDAVKISITKPLETLFGVKYGMSSFRVRLTYSSYEMPKKTENGRDCNQDYKKRKTGFGSRRCSNSSQDTVISANTLDKKVEPCALVISHYRMPIFIGGRYLKYSRNVSQTRWIIDDERMGEASIEEIVVGGIIPFCKGDNYKFHAAGREDIDVRMLGSGRPFLLEIQNPRVVPSELCVKEMEMKINTSPGKLVKVINLKVVDEEVWTLMREGEAEKQKQYAALVWISRPLEDKDLQTISSLEELKLLQRTPVRVLHRRSPLDREKIIHWMKIEKITGSTQYFLLHLCTQAGTYIKEFVHGDLGRTHPSIGSILGCRAEILQLDVTDVKMDCFL